MQRISYVIQAHVLYVDWQPFSPNDDIAKLAFASVIAASFVVIGSALRQLVVVLI